MQCRYNVFTHNPAACQASLDGLFNFCKSFFGEIEKNEKTTEYPEYEYTERKGFFDGITGWEQDN